MRHSPTSAFSSLLGHPPAAHPHVSASQREYLLSRLPSTQEMKGGGAGGGDGDGGSGGADGGLGGEGGEGGSRGGLGGRGGEAGGEGSAGGPGGELGGGVQPCFTPASKL